MKLLRTAAPTSGASKNEQQIAALEAAKIIAENDLTLIEQPPHPRRASAAAREAAARQKEAAERFAREMDVEDLYSRKKSNSYSGIDYDAAARTAASRFTREDRYSSTYSGIDWDEVIIQTTTQRCVICGRPIYRGDRAWRSPRAAYRCYDIACDQAV